jgi:hypothetical protein
LVSTVTPPIFAVVRAAPDEAGLDTAVAALDGGVPLALPEPADEPPHAATINVTASPADASHLLRIEFFPFTSSALLGRVWLAGSAVLSRRDP